MQDRRDAFNYSRHLETLHPFKEEGADECYMKKINGEMVQKTAVTNPWYGVQVDAQLPADNHEPIVVPR